MLKGEIETASTVDLRARLRQIEKLLATPVLASPITEDQRKALKEERDLIEVRCPY